MSNGLGARCTLLGVLWGNAPIPLSGGVHGEMLIAVLEERDIAGTIKHEWLARFARVIEGVLEKGLQLIQDSDFWEEVM